MASGSDSRLSQLNMRPPPLRSDLLGPSSDAGSSPGPVAEPGLGPAALASPIGVEGVTGETAEPEAPRTKTAKSSTRATDSESNPALAPLPPRDVSPPPSALADSGQTKTANVSPPAPAPRSSAASNASSNNEEIPPVPPIADSAGADSQVDQLSDLPPPPAVSDSDQPASSPARSAADNTAETPRAPGQTVDETYQRRLAASSPDRTSIPASEAGSAGAGQGRGGTRMAALEPPNRPSPESIGVPTPGVKPFIVEFAFGSADLTDEGRKTIQQVVNAYRAAPGKKIRIVGHASSKTADMAVGDHMLANFEMSLKRATAVSDELMKLGVDPGAVVVEAVGDRQPLYYEAMPTGEAGNRRAEVYLE